MCADFDIFFRCKGSPWGQCCSVFNFCGNTAEHCGETCQAHFGDCDAYKKPGKPSSSPTPVTLKTVVSSPTAYPKPLTVSPNGDCGGDTG